MIGEVMLPLNVTFDSTLAVDPEYQVNFYANISERGIASGDVDYDTPLNETPLDLFYGAQDLSVWQNREWMNDVWQSDVTTPTVSFTTPLIHFGSVAVGAMSVDAAGNLQAGASQETSVVVNTTPFPATGLRRTDWDEEAATQSFILDQSPQLTGTV